MLKYADKKSGGLPIELSAEEDHKLRLAFGRFAEEHHRQAGSAVVSTHYEKHRFLHCDCRPDCSDTPLLFLVSGTHIRRQMDGKGTAHNENCVFARDPLEQKELIASYRESQSEDVFQLNLLRNFATKQSLPQDGGLHVTTNRSRPALARTLCLLLAQAKLDRFYAKDAMHGNQSEQIKYLEQAATHFTLAPDQNLSDWLAISLPDLYNLKKLLIQNADRWKRPHGIFIGTFDRIENKTLYPRKAGLKPILISGRLSVFGEGEILQRPPYLVIGLLGQPSRNAKNVEFLDAYAHPCVSWDRLTLVDSQLERETLKLLMSCRDWLAKHHGIETTIKKTLFDVGASETKDSRELCLPDFILSCRGANVLQKTVVIETMGYSDPGYRERKQRMRLLFERVGSGPYPVPIIEHDRFQSGITPEAVDRNFCRTLCQTIAGNAPNF